MPLLNPDLLARDAPRSLPVFDVSALPRRAPRAVRAGRPHRLAEGRGRYSVATFLFASCVPEVSHTDTPSRNDLSGAARALEELHVPFDAVVLPHPALVAGPPREPDLSGYRLLIAPSLERLSDADLARLARWLRGGGTLAVLGKLGQRDEGNRPRARDALAELRAAGKVRVLIGGASLPQDRAPFSREAHALAAKLMTELGELATDPVVAGELPGTTWVKTWRHAGGFVSGTS